MADLAAIFDKIVRGSATYIKQADQMITRAQRVSVAMRDTVSSSARASNAYSQLALTTSRATAAAGVAAPKLISVAASAKSAASQLGATAIQASASASAMLSAASSSGAAAAALTATGAASHHLLGSLLGFGLLAITLRHLIGAFTGAAAAAEPLSKAKPGSVDAEYKRLSEAVKGAWEAFAGAFAATANFAATLQSLTGYVTGVTPILARAGAVLGRLTGWFVACAPAAIATGVAMKGASMALMLFLQHKVLNFALSFVGLSTSILRVKGAQMALNVVTMAYANIQRMANAGDGQRLIANLMRAEAAQKVLNGVSLTYGGIISKVTVGGARGFALMAIKATGLALATGLIAPAVWLVNGAIAATNGLLAVTNSLFLALMAIGLPIWVAIAAAVVIVAAAIAAVVYACMWLFSSAPAGAGKTAAELKKLGKESQEAADAAEQMRQQFEDAAIAAEFGQAAVDLDKYAAKLTEAGKSEEELNRAIADAQAYQARRVEAEKLKKLTEEIARLQKEADQAGMSGPGKAADDVRRAGGSARQQADALDAAERAESIAKAEDKRRDRVREIAAIEKEVALAGLTANERRIKQLEELGVKGAELAKAKDQIAAAEAKEKAAERQKDLEREIASIQREASYAGLTETEKRLKQLEELGAKEADIAKAREQFAAADDAAKAKDLVEKSRTPLQKYQEQLALVERLRRAQKISAEEAAQALAAAGKDFNGSLHSGGSRGSDESPKALARGTADAQLAANRQTNPTDRLAQPLREAVVQQKKIEEHTLAMLDAIKDNKPPVPQIASIN